MANLPYAICWAAVVGVVFFAVYPTTNAWTTRRAYTWAWYADWELSIPFWPQAVWVYLSMYLLFVLPVFFMDRTALRHLAWRLIAGTLISGAVFVLLPGHLGYVRVLPAHPLLARLFEAMFTLDAVHNTLPSLHVVYSSLILWALTAGRPWVTRTALNVWLMAIAASTLLVHQHHIMDVVCAFVLAAALQHWIPFRPRGAA